MSAVRGQRITEQGAEPVADPALRRHHRRGALRIGVWSIAVAAGATAGLTAL
jgi:hypothetical protein